MQEMEEWFSEQATGDRVVAKYYCGVFLETIQKKPKEALDWYKKAADLKYAPAQHTIGLNLYNAGNVEEAVSWLQKAAEAGHIEAITMLEAIKPKAQEVSVVEPGW